MFDLMREFQVRKMEAIFFSFFRGQGDAEGCVCEIVFFFSLFNGHAPSVWKFLGQELNPGVSCDPLHSCSNAGSFTHCTRLGIKPELPQHLEPLLSDS